MARATVCVKMDERLTESERYKLGQQNSQQQAQHKKLFSDLFRAVSTGGIIVLTVRGTPTLQQEK